MIEMVITDLDGTLLRDDKTVSEYDIKTLKKLGKKGICRVAATGRTFYNLRVLPDDFPLDYVVFSSGAGIYDWQRKKLLKKYSLLPQQVQRIKKILLEHDVDFHIYKTIPNNHYFARHETGRSNSDFYMLYDRYKKFKLPMDIKNEEFGEACQFLVIFAYHTHQFDKISQQVGDSIKIIRATSPVDSQSVWMEFFNPEVSKGNGAAWICQKDGIDETRTIGIGNDYNDLDLLKFTRHSFFVENAPDELKSMYETTHSNMNSGFSATVKKFVEI